MSMQPYLDQLLEDLRARHGQLPPEPNWRALYPNHPAPEGLEYIIAWENGYDLPMPELFDLPADAFPPPEQLDEDQIAALSDAILTRWASFHIQADIPDNIPYRIVYPVLRDRWVGEPVSVVWEGALHLEFCDYEPERCPWGEVYCTCKDFDDFGLSDAEGKPDRQK